jgi:hypothetical protein
MTKGIIKSYSNFSVNLTDIKPLHGNYNNFNFQVETPQANHTVLKVTYAHSAEQAHLYVSPKASINWEKSKKSQYEILVEYIIARNLKHLKKLLANKYHKY